MKRLILSLLVSSSVLPLLTVWGQAGGIAARASLDPNEDIAFHALAIPDTVWVGQQVTYQVGVFLSAEIRARLRRNPVFIPPELRSMLSYDMASRSGATRMAGNRQYEVHVFQRALFPLTSGAHVIPPSHLEYALPLSNSFFAREEGHSSLTEELVVIARDPPLDGRPPGFKGAVGRLSIQDRSDQRSLETGHPFVYTVTVLGTGNVSLLPRPEISFAWADVVPGAVRVRMDSTATLVRGRKEFDWIVTPLKPGRQEIPAMRYPYFDPYSGQYEVAVSRARSFSVTGSPVVVDRSESSTSVALPIRRSWGGEIPDPVTSWRAFWIVAGLAPLPFVLLLFSAVRTRRTGAPSAEGVLLDAAKAGAVDVALVRRILATELGSRICLTADDMADRARMERSLRRAGVSPATSEEVIQLVGALQDAVFSREGLPVPDGARRAARLLRAVDQEARSRETLNARRAVAALGLVTMISLVSTGAVSGAPASQQDIVALKLFGSGLAAWDAREYGLARQAFQELAQARPRSVDAWFNFGNASWQLQDTAAAVVGWQKALRLQPAARDIRDRVRMSPGPKQVLLGVPPVTVSQIGVVGLILWLSAWSLLALWRRNGRSSLRTGGILLLMGVVVALIAGLRQQEIVDGRGTAVVLAVTNLRDLPALSADPGVQAQPGEVVRVLTHQGVWTRIRLLDDRIGWVGSQRITELGSRSSKSAGAD